MDFVISNCHLIKLERHAFSICGAPGFGYTWLLRIKTINNHEEGIVFIVDSNG